MLTGVVALVMILWLYRVTPLGLYRVTPLAEATEHEKPSPPIDVQSAVGKRRRGLVPGLGRLVLLFTALHVFFMGYTKWMDETSWPGYLPPITLLSFVSGVGFVVSRMLR